MSRVSAEHLAAAIAEVADTLVDDFDVIDFLHLVAARAAELVDAAAVGLLLRDEERNLQFVAGSQQVAEMLEQLQVHNDEGPCVEAFRNGAPVTNTDLGSAADQWPHFAPAAAAAGFTGVHAMPMTLRDQVIGGVNLFTSDGRTLDPADLRIVRAFAHVATVGLLQERAIQQASLLTSQLERALSSRLVIEQAKGAIAQRHGVTVDEAFTALRGYARRNHHKLTDLAAAYVQHPSRFPPW
ncbi:MAG TPA: GAF and ANTAR domain-containing protein [Propionibacteriaceae bacterium]|nr:GAF and ANTAR domain-containing protein [Propionibacteriaceae bacterium]